MGELNIYGVYVPVLLIQSVFAYGLLRLVMTVTDPLIEKGWIPLAGIFYFCLYVILLWLIHWGFIVCFA